MLFHKKFAKKKKFQLFQDLVPGLGHMLTSEFLAFFLGEVGLLTRENTSTEEEHYNDAGWPKSIKLST